MKLLFITDNGFCKKNDTAYYSGANIQHYEVATKYFTEISFIAKTNPYNDTYTEVNKKYPVYFINALFSLNFLKNRKKLRSIIKNEISSTDVVMCFGITGLFTYKIAKRNNKKLLVYVGGSYYESLQNMGSPLKGLFAGIIDKMIRRMILKADYVHYVDDYLKVDYPTKGEILVCPSVRIKLDKQNLKTRIDKINKKSVKSDKLIGLIGYVHNKIKGIECAIEAMKLLPEEYRLQIVGGGDSKNLENFAKECGVANRVDFLGVLKRESLFIWLASIDIYIQPSLTEGMPRATIEAMSYACPTITTSVGGLKSLTDSKYMISIGDYKELSKKIKMISENKNEQIIQAKRNFSKAEKFDKKKLDGIRNKFYSAVITQG